MYVQLNQWKKAADDYRRSIEIDGQSIMALSRAAWLMATCPVEDFRNEALALEAARQAVQLEKEPHFRRLDVLAAALANAGLFDEAKQTVGKAVEQAPVSERPVLEGAKKAVRVPRTLSSQTSLTLKPLLLCGELLPKCPILKSEHINSEHQIRECMSDHGRLRNFWSGWTAR